jgi:hypothetical protein
MTAETAAAIATVAVALIGSIGLPWSARELRDTAGAASYLQDCLTRPLRRRVIA